MNSLLQPSSSHELLDDVSVTRSCLVLVLMFAGCRFTASNPANGAAACQTDSDCPVGMTCIEAIGHCFAATSTGMSPNITAIEIVPTRVANQGTIQLSVRADQELYAPPLVIFSTGKGRRAASFVGSVANEYRYSFTADSTQDGEGLAAVAANVVAASGASSNELRLGTVEFDFTPANVVEGSTRLSLTPPSQCPLPRIEAMSANATATLEFVVDESSTVVLESEPPGLPSRQLRGTSNYFAYALSGRAPDGTYRLFARIVDAVGNTRRVDLEQTIQYDSTPPPVPDVVAETEVIYRRLPWGSLDAGALFEVEATAMGLRGATALEVFDGPVALGLGLASSSDSGVTVHLPRIDRPVVSVRGLDWACNASNMVNVQTIDWTATLAGKVPGQSFENPHQLLQTDSFSSALESSLWSRETSLPTAQQFGRAEWLAIDGAPLATQSNPLFVTTGPPPPANPQASVFFDSRRRRVILFGGFNGSTPTPWSDELWEWDGEHWENRTPRIRPSSWPRPVERPGMAFDSIRGKAVFFGGQRGQVWSNELLEWDSDSNVWVNRTPQAYSPNWPSPRVAPSLAFDRQRRRIVMFGGVGPGLAPLSDLWEWDGESWRSLTPASWPLNWPSPGGTLIYDETLAGIAYLSSDGRSIWDYGSTNKLWAQRPLLNGVAANRWATFSIPNRQSIFAMSAAQLSGPTRFFELVDDWSEKFIFPLSSTTGPIVMNQALGGGACFDASGNRVVIATHQFVTEWNPVDGGTNTIGTPSIRKMFFGAYEPTLVSNPLTQSVSLINSFGSVWSLSGSDHTWRLPPANAGTIPPSRHGQLAAIDPTRQKIFSFGGMRTDYGAWESLLDDSTVWEYDVARSVWSARSQHMAARRALVQLVFDPRRNRFLFFGGRTSSAARDNGLWALDAASGEITSLTPSPLPVTWPSPVVDGASAFDTSLDRLLVFGGETTTGASNELWQWSPPTGWQNLTPNPRPRSWPPPTTGARAQFLNGTGQLAVFGGTANGEPSDELWLWQPDTGWSNMTPSPRPPSWPSRTSRVALAVEQEQQRLVAFDQQWEQRTWAWTPKRARLPGLSAVFGFRLAGPGPNATIAEAQVLATGETSHPSGVRLLIPLDGALRPVTSGRGPLRWSSTEPAVLNQLFKGPRGDVWVGLTPAAEETTSPPTSISASWFELRIRYRRND